MLQKMWQYDISFVIVSVIKSVLMGISPIVNIIFPKLIIDQFTNQKGLKYVGMIIGIWLGIDIVLIISNKLIERHISIRKDFLNNHFLFSVYEKMVNLDLVIFQDPNVQDLKKKATDVVGRNMASSFCNDIFKMISSIITILSTVIVLATVNFTVFLILGIIIIFNILIMISQKREQYTFWDKITPLNKKTDYYFQLLSDPVYVKEMKMYSLSSWITKKYNYVKNQFFALAKTLYNKLLFLMSIQETLNVIQRSVVYFYLAWNVIMRGMSFGNFTMFFSSIQTFSTNLTNIFGILINTVEQSVYIDSYRNFLALENHIAVENQTNNLQKLPQKIHSINLQNVTFTYPGQKSPALREVTIDFYENQFYVLVGHNGAGKTTLVNLLCRLYDPQEGRVAINDIDIKQFDFKKYRNAFGVVFQDYKYYSFTIGENIALDRYNKDKKTTSRILKSIDQAGLTNMVKKLPNGIETSLTRLFDDTGIDLSGGEAQKLALAKSLFHESSILILDEPSSALDPIAEEDLIAQVKKISKEKTVLYISHRLSTATSADKVIFMENGKIVAVGSHTELITNCKPYAEMFYLQAKHYQKEDGEKNESL